MAFETCLQKQNEVKIIFTALSTPEMRYQKIIELGRALPPLRPEARIPSNLVSGCQSTMYLEVLHQDGTLLLNADSDALISKGLAALLIHVYSGESPGTVAHCRPTFIQEIGLLNILSPSRSNGLISLYRKLEQEALKCLV